MSYEVSLIKFSDTLTFYCLNMFLILKFFILREYKFMILENDYSIEFLMILENEYSIEF